MAKAPAFQFYPRDYVSDERVIAMTLEERGAYIQLLCHQWLEQTIPENEKVCAKLCGVSTRVFRRLWPALAPCFEDIGDGRLQNVKLEAQRKQDDEWREGQATHGRKGAEKRWAGHDKPNREPMATPMANDSSAPASASASTTTTPPTPPPQNQEAKSWNGENHIGKKAGELWRRLGLKTTRGYNWAQGEAVVNGLLQHWEEDEILGAITKISQTPALAWAADKGPAYLARSCGESRVSVMETVHRWRDDEERNRDTGTPVAVAQDIMANVARTKAMLRGEIPPRDPAAAKDPAPIGDILKDITP